MLVRLVRYLNGFVHHFRYVFPCSRAGKQDCKKQVVNPLAAKRNVQHIKLKNTTGERYYLITGGRYVSTKYVFNKIHDLNSADADSCSRYWI